MLDVFEIPLNAKTNYGEQKPFLFFADFTVSGNCLLPQKSTKKDDGEK